MENFINVTDFCKQFEGEIVKHQLNAANHKVRNRKASLSDSELITILVAFHSGHFYQPEALLSVLYLKYTGTGCP